VLGVNKRVGSDGGVGRDIGITVVSGRLNVVRGLKQTIKLLVLKEVDI
jgi:hypothetical protein